MKVIIVIAVAFLFIACRKPSLESVELTEVYFAIIDDTVKRNPIAQFVYPPTEDKNDRIGYCTLNTSEMKFGISDIHGDSIFNHKDLAYLFEYINEEQSEYFYLPSESADVEQLSQRLGLNLSKSDYDVRIDEPSDLYPLRGVFYFSKPVTFHHEDIRYLAVAMNYYCGKLCVKQRLYILHKYKRRYKVVHSKMLNPHKVI